MKAVGGGEGGGGDGGGGGEGGRMMFDKIKEENRRSAAGRNEVFSSAVVMKEVRKTPRPVPTHSDVFSDISTRRHLVLINQ